MLETVISSSVLIAVLILLRAVFKGRIGLRLQYAVWLLAALRLLLPFSLFESSVSIMNVAGVGAGTAQTGAPAYVQPAETTVAPPAAYINMTAAGTATAGPRPAAPANAAAPDAPVENAPAASPEAILQAVWLTGAAAVGLWFTVQNLWLGAALRKTRQRVALPDSRLPVIFDRVRAGPLPVRPHSPGNLSDARQSERQTNRDVHPCP